MPTKPTPDYGRMSDEEFYRHCTEEKLLEGRKYYLKYRRLEDALRERPCLCAALREIEGLLNG